MPNKTPILFLFLLSFTVTSLFSQQLWTKAYKEKITQQKKEIFGARTNPKEYVLMNLDVERFKNTLASVQSKSITPSKTIELPNSDGLLKRFSIEETSYLASGLAEKFPMIKSYSARGIDDASASAKISIGADGVHVIVFSTNKSTLYIDPYTKDKQEYIIYKKSSVSTPKNNFECKVEDAYQQKTTSQKRSYANDGKLRTFRMAIACTGEYAQFHLNRQGTSPSASDAEKKAVVLSAMNTTITRVNGIYERDLAVRMIIVDNNDNLIFLDGDTDGLSNDNANNLIDESQQKCDNIIGNTNYDIGHTFSTGGGGLAQLGSVCVTGLKAQGITGSSQPINDTYDIDYVAHEVGHQFGATHTFNNSCDGNRSSSTAVEPGSGSTIMAYAGICSPNVQNVSDDYFHTVSINQMWNHVQGAGSCATLSDTGNTAPTANAGNDVSIPKSTPFVLKGQATDVDGTASLTYTWEQIDNETATMSPLSTNTGGPMFRSITPSSSSDRYMPALSTVLSGNTSTTWEVLPSVARELNFAFTVRDNHTGGGSSARDDMKITVVDTDPFTITRPSSLVSWGTGAIETITWNKGITNQAPINCAKVNIRLSTDGGLTFPILLKANTDNDGSEDVVIPDTPTTNARILVEAADNVFYNVNNTNFTIFPADPTFSISNTTGDMSVCNKGTNELVFDLDYKALYGFTETVNLSYSGTPTNSNITLSTTTINTSGKFTLTITNLSSVVKGDYTITVTGTSPSTTKSVNILLNVNDSLCNSSGNTESQVSITNVKFNSIDYNSTKTTGYSDFKAESTQVVRGESYDLTTTINSDGNSNIKTFAWIDWNQNCTFDNDETYEVISNTVTITVPENAPLGSTVMRISTRPDSDPNSCSTNFNGEVEDYTVTVEENFATDSTLFDDLQTYPVPSDGTLTIEFKVKDKNSTIIRLFDFKGRLIETQKFSTISSAFNKEIQFNKASGGFYLLQIENAGKQITKKIAIN